MLVWRRLSNMQLSRCDINGYRQICLRTFIALLRWYNFETKTYYFHHSLAISLIATVFGGIHCAGWKFVFPSHTEKIIWRVASSIISLIPCVIFIALIPATLWVYKINHGLPASKTTQVLAGIGTQVWRLVRKVLPIYLLARVILLLEAFIALRDLPQGAYVQVKWLRFVPHI